MNIEPELAGILGEIDKKRNKIEAEVDESAKEDISTSCGCTDIFMNNTSDNMVRTLYFNYEVYVILSELYIYRPSRNKLKTEMVNIYYLRA